MKFWRPEQFKKFISLIPQDQLLFKNCYTVALFRHQGEPLYIISIILYELWLIIGEQKTPLLPHFSKSHYKMI